MFAYLGHGATICVSQLIATEDDMKLLPNIIDSESTGISSTPLPKYSAQAAAKRQNDAMPDLATEVTTFMAEYERAANSHDVERVLPWIADDATYWFTDGSYRGREEVAGALERTFGTIHGEVYEIRNLEWVTLTDGHAACRYRFRWRGVVDGQRRSGRGRGTNVLVKRNGAWQVQHEHLSY
jgi:ketosteroid isomerase-like protein